MYLRLNTQFNPFTYDELVKPLADYGKVYKDVEQQYSDLLNGSSVWESLGNNPVDADVYEQYKIYNKDLENDIQDLTTNGLTEKNRKSLLKMKARYNKEIAPIAQAYQARQKYATIIQEAAKDPTMMVNRKASDIGLSKFMKDPNLTPDIQSGALITKRVADKIKNYATNNIKASSWKTTGPEEQLLERIVTTGLTRSDLQNIIFNPQSFPEITKLIKDVVSTTGIENWEDKNALNKAYQYAYEGLYAGLGKSDIDVRNNAEHITPYQKFMIDKQNSGKNNDKKPLLNNVDRTFYSFPKDVEKITDFLDKEGKLGFKVGYGNYVNHVFKNGKWHRPEAYNPVTKEGDYSYRILKPATDYYDAINSVLINAGYTQDRLDNMNREEIESALQKIRKREAVDGISRSLYRTSLDDVATEHLFSKMKEKGYKFQKLEGFKKEKDKYIPKYGSNEELEYSPKSTTSIHLDPITKDFVILYDGEWYKIPTDLISSDLSLKIEDYFTQDNNGISKFSKAQEVYTTLKNIEKERKLTDRESYLLNAADEALLNMDSSTGEIGKNFTRYVGTKNTQ